MLALGVLLMAVTLATEGRGVTVKAGMVAVAAFSTRGRVLVAMTGVIVIVFCGVLSLSGEGREGGVWRLGRAEAFPSGCTGCWGC